MPDDVLDFVPPTLNLLAYRGDDLPPITLTFAESVDENNVPVTLMDVTGWGITAQVRGYFNAPDVLAEFTVDDTDAASGVIVLLLGAADTEPLPARELVWDCQRTEPDVLTLFAGSFSVGGDVTRVVAP